MAKRIKKAEEIKHVHDWYPIAVDYDHEFAFYECTDCTETLWRNVQQAYPAEALED